MVACSGIGVGARPCPIVAPPRPRLSATRPPARPSFGRLAPPLGARTRLPRGNLARAVGDRESGGKAGDGTDAERGRGRDKALSPSKPPPPEPIATSPPPPPPSRWARLLAALAGIPWLRLVRLAIHAIIIGWLLDAVPLALFANPSSPPAVAFSDFVEGVNRGEVARLQVDGATVLFSVHESSQLGQAARRFQGQLSTGPAASKPSSGASSSSSGAVEKANRFLGFSGGRRSIDSSTPSTRPGPPPVRRKSASTVALATVRPADYPMPYALLAQQGVAVWAAPPQPSLLRRTFTVVLASAAALLGLLSLLRLASPLLGALAQRSGWAPGRGAAAQGAGGARASFDGSRSTRFSDVAGMPEAKQELAEVVDMLRHPAKYAALGARPPSGVLLSGPPGTGKTLLARAVAGEAGVPFFAATASEFVELYVGMGALRVRSLFAAARRHPAAIVFIDELDAVGKSRESRLRAASNDEREQTLNQLLAELDGFEGANKDGRRVEGGEGEGKGQDKKRRSLAGLFGPPSRPSSPPLVICIAATNRPDVLDAALLRPGRFDRRVSVGLPDSQGRAEILQAHLARQGLPLAPDVDVRQLASDSAGSSGADLANVVNEAALMAARRVVGDGQTTRAAGEGAEPIEQDRRQSDASAPPGPPSCSPPTLVAQADFTEALLKTLMGPPRARGLASSLERQAVAVHEAGHAAVRQACRVLLPHTPPPSRVSVRPRVNGAAGFTQMAAPEEDRTLLFEAELRAELAVLLAGRAAERACGGGAGASSGAEDDLRRATALARRAAGVYGLSEAIGPVSVEGLGEGEGGWSKEVEREVGSMLRRAQAAALEVVRANEQVVRGLADELLREELVEGGKLKEHLAGVVATEGLREFVSNSGCDSKRLPVEGAASGQLVFSHSNSGKGT